jgi:hypothetical protein
MLSGAALELEIAIPVLMGRAKSAKVQRNGTGLAGDPPVPSPPRHVTLLGGFDCGRLVGHVQDYPICKSDRQSQQGRPDNPASFKRVQRTIEPIDGVGLRWVGCDLHLINMAASSAPQRPAFEPRSRRGDPQHHLRRSTTART